MNKNQYIRTENGIFLLDESWDMLLEDMSIKKRIGTLEELCDEFVVALNQEAKGYLVLNQCRNSFEKVVSLNKEAKQIEATIYGAIWTDKGLIYVAKLNEKGELELL